MEAKDWIPTVSPWWECPHWKEHGERWTREFYEWLEYRRRTYTKEQFLRDCEAAGVKVTTLDEFLKEIDADGKKTH